MLKKHKYWELHNHLYKVFKNKGSHVTALLNDLISYIVHHFYYFLYDTYNGF